jgi:hypothetical protein
MVTQIHSSSTPLQEDPRVEIKEEVAIHLMEAVMEILLKEIITELFHKLDRIRIRK